jgi:hypothetical protein
LSGETTVIGLDRQRRRLRALAAIDAKPALRTEADAIAEAARNTLATNKRSVLARSVKVIDIGRENAPAFTVGTDDPAGLFLEFGTRRQRATPWLGPAFRARLPRIKQTLRRLITASFNLKSG